MKNILIWIPFIGIIVFALMDAFEATTWMEGKLIGWTYFQGITTALIILAILEKWT